MNRKWTGMWLCFLALFLSGTAALAQTITGSVRGTVTDPSGAVVAGATVTSPTQVPVLPANHADKSGLYDFEFLVLGNYTVTVTAPGFNRFSGTVYGADRPDRIADVKLQVGEPQSTTVKVVGNQALLLDAENSTVSTSISSTP